MFQLQFTNVYGKYFPVSRANAIMAGWPCGITQIVMLKVWCGFQKLLSLDLLITLNTTHIQIKHTPIYI